VSCDSGDSGCDGGWPTNAYNWIAKNGGQVSEADYPYTSGDAGVVPACNNNNMAKLVTVSQTCFFLFSFFLFNRLLFHIAGSWTNLVTNYSTPLSRLPLSTHTHSLSLRPSALGR
jgi:hypothetical protein